MSSISRANLINVLCDLYRENRREDVLPVLSKLELTMTQARSLIASENPRVGTIDYVRSLNAREIMLFSDMDSCFKNETIPTPPQSARQ